MLNKLYAELLTNATIPSDATDALCPIHFKEETISLCHPEAASFDSQ
ncbi:MAG: hypothetical protein ACJ8CB_27860 [Ktedonobacteraceae bacterium]